MQFSNSVAVIAEEQSDEAIQSRARDSGLLRLRSQ
jgi:hypothetical protein